MTDGNRRRHGRGLLGWMLAAAVLGLLAHGQPAGAAEPFGLVAAGDSSLVDQCWQILQNLFNSSAPDKGVGFTLNIPIRNRQAQSVQERSLMEYRQSELRLAQLYTQIRMQIVNAQFALTNDRALVQSSIAARDYAQQSLDAEQKKLRLGASTTALVLQQERNLATAENNLIAANAKFASDRAGLYQVLATTLQHYGINLGDAAKGEVNSVPIIPGVQPAKTTTGPSIAPPPASR